MIMNADSLLVLSVSKPRDGALHSIDLARHLAVSKTSVSRVVAILQQGGFLTVE